ncbi:MAG: hypothetical protein AAGA69_11070 [Pseudomonadota bacterium]
MSEILAAAMIFLLSTSSAMQEASEISREEGLENWDRVYEILSHPRCVNCHVGADNRPRWSGVYYGLEPGEWKYHGMHVHGGQDRIGIRTITCTTCHMSENSNVPHGPPGAEVWALAPVEMEWFGKESAHICQQLQDPARNGGRSLQEVADHIDHDALVHWGWAPGPGREPAPYSVAEAVTFVEAWAAAGAPCPGEGAAVVDPGRTEDVQ